MLLLPPFSFHCAPLSWGMEAVKCEPVRLEQSLNSAMLGTHRACAHSRYFSSMLTGRWELDALHLASLSHVSIMARGRAPVLHAPRGALNCGFVGEAVGPKLIRPKGEDQTVELTLPGGIVEHLLRLPAAFVQTRVTRHLKLPDRRDEVSGMVTGRFYRRTH